MSVNWNNVRQAIYVIGAGILGAAAVMGWITAEQGEQLTAALTEALGAVAMIVAAANVNKGTVSAPVLPAEATGGLPVYDGPTSALEAYEGRHWAKG